MSALHHGVRRWLFWLLPFVALALLIGWQTDYGRAWSRVPPAETAVAPQPVKVAVLPEYRPAVTPDVNRDIVDRSLFNPTRRPAPAAVVETAKPKMQRGQFALAGTMVVDGKAVALLREVAGGKSRRATQGETINGMTVAEVKADLVRLTMGGESEELVLKLAVGPRTTVQPAVAAAPTAVAARAMAAAAAANAALPQQAPTSPQDVASILAERRRAARAAEVAAGNAPPGTPVVPQTQNTQPAPAQAAATPPAPPPDPAWEAVYQRYRQPRR